MQGIDQRTLDKFLTEFESLIGLIPEFDRTYANALIPYINYLSSKKLLDFNKRKALFIALINKKFELNAKAIADLYSTAAGIGYTFNFHQKNNIQKAFDSNDLVLFEKVLKSRGVNKDNIQHLAHSFIPISETETIKHVQRECENPSKLRMDPGRRDIKNEILKALFSAFLWGSLPTEEIHSYFDPHYSKKEYQESFWKQLHSRKTTLFNRDNTLSIIRIDQNLINQLGDTTSITNSIISLIPETFHKLNNYGYLAVIIENIENQGRPLNWEIAADLTLIGEKFNELSLQKNYFQWKKIKNDTEDFIGANIPDANFELVNEGFTYRDTFVLTNRDDQVDKLLLIFQKNERDETLVACPSCRSENVQGNSYSSLGVRSWECKNPLCPDRSKYNRGKRYSFKNLLMQQAIEDENNTIPMESVRRWQRDVVSNVTNEEISDMLVRHYSIYADTIHTANWDIESSTYLGREIVSDKISFRSQKNFFLNRLFKRYLIPAQKNATPTSNLGDEKFQVYHGDASTVLRSFPENHFDGAVTSPPYYNAREYSQWPNMYCYLYDMFDLNSQVFRTLKPGGIYLYNIFDYFDNENTIAFSAMAQKRMILSAYTVDLFRRIGFELLGNIVWDKGDIEGKRGFNAGNFSPFYQSPFNCWEHILIFQKPDNGTACEVGDTLLNVSKSVFKCKPVMKMIKGKNTYGHTAPFPEELPRLLTSRLPKGSMILDPFGGSMTTGRVAEQDGLRSVCIELSKEYCELGLLKRQSPNLLSVTANTDNLKA